MNETTSAYDKVFEMASPVIKHYRNDLVKHDKRAIDENAGIPFLHFTGDTGTSITFFHPAEKYPGKNVTVPYLFGHADRNHILDETKNIIFYMRKLNRQDVILYYNGSTVKKITQDTAEDLVTKYYYRMLREFDAS